VALVKADVSEEHITCIITVTRIGKLRTTSVADHCRPDEDGDALFRNVGSYKSHMAKHAS
jgi:hypothetical protein